ncbi:Aste57867_9572 [Aphanomyces stellatus]|uniref:Aste57867_9572 protein n=1 Tax=Aphanomyces stellatus TaxID=120398 RepID=A0A485KNA9_9STRA|nr:hypothetical protein As57867_009534 [Aphanomyces stellatus]VFT86451.1 Aste57867_9572 [Aphanomyces stellatus]
MTLSPMKSLPSGDGADTGDAATMPHVSAIHAAKEAALAAAKAQCEEQLIRRDFQGAYATIVESVKDAVGLYGKASLHLVPHYLCMAEVGLELSHMNQVEEVLALCIWNIVKSTEEDAANESKTLSHRALVCKFYGRYHSECEHFDEAIKQAANGAYYASLVHGPEHIVTSTLYYTLGAIFQKNFRTEEALGMFDKVVEIWYKHLAAATTSQRNQDDGFLSLEAKQSNVIERIHHEGAAILVHVLDTRGKILGETHIATGEVQYTMGLLRLYMGDMGAAKQAILKALSIYTDALGSLHPSTVDVQSVLDQF